MTGLQYPIRGGVLFYETGKHGITVTGYHGTSSIVEVPDSIEGQPVTALDKKAFLNQKDLKRVFLPASLEEVGNWAFAHCPQLESVCLPSVTTRLGKGIFLECPRLKRVSFRKRDAQEERCAGEDTWEALLAAVPNILDAEYLFVPTEAGSAAWLEKWDARMLTLLHQPDQEGFTRMVLCGEEDYGSTDLERFVNHRRKEKIRLAFLRLLHDGGLKTEVRQELQEYLLAHTKGCASEETWEVLLEEHGDELSYFRLFAALGCVTAENFDDILQDMREEHPEMKAFLLRYKEENLIAGDFFDTLSLDF